MTSALFFSTEARGGGGGRGGSRGRSRGHYRNYMRGGRRSRVRPTNPPKPTDNILHMERAGPANDLTGLRQWMYADATSGIEKVRNKKRGRRLVSALIVTIEMGVVGKDTFELLQHILHKEKAPLERSNSNGRRQFRLKLDSSPLSKCLEGA
ncbi:hypothetical protein HNY73_021987 [Argiope bruennichi]|uniref:Uncharacterized protein n=1 Tax=Argiope bruennichi TaxID=94029 RepID=A0A8T0DZF1_ARGBR|nr:hypothetical protein HNY73_021987 [Argiope bruennichi]